MDLFSLPSKEKKHSIHDVIEEETSLSTACRLNTWNQRPLGSPSLNIEHRSTPYFLTAIL